VVNDMPWLLYPWKSDPEPIVPHDGWVPEPVCTGAENLALAGFDPHTVQPVASCYNDYPVPAHSNKYITKWGVRGVAVG